MSGNAGVWIDHRKAIIIILSTSGERITQINSDVEKHVRSSGGSQSRSTNGAQSSSAEDVIEHRFANHLEVYYKKVIETLKDAEHILVMGPGEARIELQKQFHDKKTHARIAENEKCDKMTDPQIAARIREFFHTTAVG